MAGGESGSEVGEGSGVGCWRKVGCRRIKERSEKVGDGVRASTMQDEGEQCGVGLMVVVGMSVGCGWADDSDEVNLLGLEDDGTMTKDYIK